MARIPALAARATASTVQYSTVQYKAQSHLICDVNIRTKLDEKFCSGQLSVMSSLHQGSAAILIVLENPNHGTPPFSPSLLRVDRMIALC
jgi:hypothetical protein